MASLDIGDGGGEWSPVLKMLEVGELCPLHVEVAAIKVVADSGKSVRDAVELMCELAAFILKVAVAVDLSNSGWIVKLACFLNKGVETPISAGEEGKEPWSCCLGNGVLSIVRPEEKLCNIGGFPRLPPSQ